MSQPATGLPADTRCFLHHEKGLFDRAVLEGVLDHFTAVEAERQAIITDPTDALRVKIGASTKALRFDNRWYDPWVNLPAASIERLRPYTWVLYPVQIRHVVSPAHMVPWHQDVGYISQMGRVHKRIITCFTPLMRDPTQGASLEFATGDFPTLAHATGGEHGAILDDSLFGNRVRFDLELGDALVFGDHTPHQTIPGKNGAIDRRSLEYRLVIPEEALDEKDYFDIESKKFVRLGAASPLTL